MILVREMPVLTTAAILEMTDKRLWRIVEHYVKTAMNAIDLSTLKAFSLDETKSRKGHRYVTVFIDLDQTKKTVIFAVPGKGKQTLKAFKDHLIAHKGKAEQVVEVVSDMSGAFISGVKTHFANSSHTVDCFHVVQLFTNALDDVRRAEAKEANAQGHPLGHVEKSRWSIDGEANRRAGRTDEHGSAHLQGMANQGNALLGAPSAYRQRRQMAVDNFSQCRPITDRRH